MNIITKLGLAAALVVSGSSLSFAEDASMKAGAAAGANAAGAGAAVDATTTGSLKSDTNYGSLISSMQADTNVDLSAFNESATVNCVGVSTLQGDANNNAQALDNAISQNQDDLTTLRGDIQANTALMTKLETSCSGIADFNAQDILSVEQGTDGTWTFYVDDRA